MAAVVEKHHTSNFKFRPEDYLTPNDIDKLQNIRLYVSKSTDIDELYEYHQELEQLIRKAYFNMKLRNLKKSDSN